MNGLASYVHIAKLNGNPRPVFYLEYSLETQ